MFTTSGVDRIATITELRSTTTDIVEPIRGSGEAILIQRNGEPYAVLLDPSYYEQLVRSNGKNEK